MNKKNLNKIKRNSGLYKGLKDAVKRYVKVKEEAKALGIFVDDRQLLECKKCGLMEDIDINGRLLTVFEKSPNKDTGLRFEKIKNTKSFRCPNCGEEVSENVEKILKVKINMEEKANLRAQNRQK